MARDLEATRLRIEAELGLLSDPFSISTEEWQP
jgi:hypothetical protein